jgi:hypothetical protein
MFASRGHKGEYCMKNCNPASIPDLKKVNMVGCEQAFNWLNKYKSCKSMNEPSFFLFMLYIVDLHNLKVEKLLRVMARPKMRGVEQPNMARKSILDTVEVRMPIDHDHDLLTLLPLSVHTAVNCSAS